MEPGYVSWKGGEVSREGVRRAVLFALARLGGGGWKLESWREGGEG